MDQQQFISFLNIQEDELSYISKDTRKKIYKDYYLF